MFAFLTHNGVMTAFAVFIHLDSLPVLGKSRILQFLSLSFVILK